MIAVYRKELRSYMTNMTGYVIIMFILLVAGITSALFNFLGGSSEFGMTMTIEVIVLVPMIPLLTMRSIAEERHQKTEQLLYSLPLQMWQIVLAKYLAMFTVFMIPVGVISLYPLLLATFGTISFANAYGAIFGYMLLGASLIAIGMFFSSLTDNQIIAAIVSFFAILLCALMSIISLLVPASAAGSLVAFTVLVLLFGLLVYFLTKNLTIALISACVAQGALLICFFVKRSMFVGAFGSVMRWLSVFDRSYEFFGGIFDLTSVIYYITITAMFVFFTVQSVEKRRWS